MKRVLALLAAGAFAGCGKPVEPASPPGPAPTNAAVRAAATNDSFGAAVADVVTQRGAIQAGKQAKAAIEAAAAHEQKALEAVMNE